MPHANTKNKLQTIWASSFIQDSSAAEVITLLIANSDIRRKLSSDLIAQTCAGSNLIDSAGCTKIPVSTSRNLGVHTWLEDEALRK